MTRAIQTSSNPHFLGAAAYRFALKTKARSSRSARPPITMSQRAVYHLLKHFGDLTDEAIAALYGPGRLLLDRGYRYPVQIDSGLRTRRLELVRKGYVRATGEQVRTTRNRKASVWTAL